MSVKVIDGTITRMSGLGRFLPFVTVRDFSALVT